jgi:hypothetical protein
METRLVAFAFAVILAAGCEVEYSAETYPEKPRQAEARAIVWGLYGMTAAAPPVEWMEGDNVGCGGNGHGFEIEVGAVVGCVGGWTYEDRWLIRAEWLGQFSSNATYAHEHAHAMLRLTTGTGDGGEDHRLDVGPIWGPGGSVAQANAALVAAGL